MNRARVTGGLLLLWAAAFAMAFVVFQTSLPTGDGFTRGMNRVAGFFGWQGAAAVLALLALATSRGLPPGHRLRRYAWFPVLAALAQALSLAGLFAWVAWFE